VVRNKFEQFGTFFFCFVDSMFFFIAASVGFKSTIMILQKVSQQFDRRILPIFALAKNLNN